MKTYTVIGLYPENDQMWATSVTANYAGEASGLAKMEVAETLYDAERDETSPAEGAEYQEAVEGLASDADRIKTVAVVEGDPAVHGGDCY